MPLVVSGNVSRNGSTAIATVDIVRTPPFRSDQFRAEPDRDVQSIVLKPACDEQMPKLVCEDADQQR
jgi:hypothetical protein